MELIIEIIFELVFDICSEVCKERKISKWIRYPIGLILSIFVIFILFIIGYVGLIAIQSNSLEAKVSGVAILLFDIILIISCIKKIKYEFKNRQKRENIG